MSAFEELGAIAPQEITEGFLARALHGNLISLAIVEIEPHAALTEHSHENEQLGIVLRGSLTFRVAEEVRSLGPGATWRISANTPHAAEAGPEGAVVIDVFTPVRDDWQRHEKLEPRRPRWPSPE